MFRILRVGILALLWTQCGIFGFAKENPAEQISVEAPSAKVTMRPYAAISSDTPAEMGYRFLLLDEQTFVDEALHYRRMVKKMESANGVAENGQIQIQFAPSFQTLTVHSLKISRNGVEAEQLALDKIKVLQRETGVESGLIDGWTTAMIIVEDLRVGDIVDFSYSTRGFNPVFANRYSNYWYVDGMMPIEAIHIAVDMPAARKLYTKSFGPRALEPRRTEMSEATRYEWRAEKLKPVEYEPEAAEGIWQFSAIQATEYAAWEDVVSWGLTLFDTQGTWASELAGPMNKWEKLPAEAAVVEALHWVQNEIRYLSIAIGESSHRPRPPAEVLKQRFGDCKDKAQLLVGILRRLGLEAYPVLATAGSGTGLDQYLPSVGAFDHCIVKVILNGKSYLIDPTLRYQAGGLNDHVVSGRQWVLPLEKGTKELVYDPADLRREYYFDVEQTYDCPAAESPVDLKLRRTYHHKAAVQMRALLANTTPEKITKERTSELSQFHPNIQSTATVKWEDDLALNRIVTEEHYRIDGFWTKTPAGTFFGQFNPFLIQDMLRNQPEVAGRKHPLNQKPHLKVRTFVSATLPETIKFEGARHQEVAPGFFYEENAQQKGNRFTVSYEFRRTADRIELKDLRNHAEKFAKVRDMAGYKITLGLNKNPAGAGEKPGDFALNWLMVFLLALVSVLMIFGLRKIYERPVTLPPLPYANPELTGLGGVLILVGFRVVVGSLVILGTLYGALRPVINLENWNALTTPSSTNFLPGAAPVLLFEAIGNIALSHGMVFACLLYFKKHALFPRWMIGLQSFTMVFVTLDFIAASWLFGAQLDQAARFESIRAIAQAMISGVIWIPYFIHSKRVKLTFIEKGIIPPPPAEAPGGNPSYRI